MNAERAVFNCDICQKSYARVDHLDRHKRTHTNERPFVCEECGKAFTRVDLLRRHQINHLQDGHPAKRARASGQRTSRACTACAESKLKCGEEHPCPRCVAKGIACEFSRPHPDVSNEQPSPHQQVNAQDETITIGVDALQFRPPEDGNAFAIQPPMHQLPTPVSALPTLQQINQPGLPELSVDEYGIFDDAYMGNFLSGIMSLNAEQDGNLIYSGPLPDVLDFAYDDFFAVPATSVPVMNNGGLSLPVSRPRSPAGAAIPGQQGVGLGHQAFKDSAWLWTPNLGDNRHAEQSFLAIRDETLIEAGISPSDTVAPPRFSQASRDRLLSMVIRSCELSVQRHVVSCFPSAASLSFILDLFSPGAPYEVSRWIHMPTVQANDEREEFLGALLATAASSSNQYPLQRLGFAIQEATRSGVADRFEEDNRNTRDLRSIQSSALLIHIGLWSGNRRKMEIAESFTYPLITMLRRSGRFRGQQNPQIISDEAWRHWLDAEAWKRMAYQMFLQDAAVSMAFVTPPLISYTELHLTLPCHSSLWRATSTHDFQQQLVEFDIESEAPPTLRDCLSNLELVSSAGIDRQMTLDIIVSCFWGRVWQYRQMMNTPTIIEDNTTNLAASALHQELLFQYRHLQMQPVDFSNAASCWKAKLELCMIHLHVSLEEIQIFAGKEGEAEARRMVPILQRWYNSSGARQALRHAGQVLRAVSQHRTGPLPGLSAVAVYHASLTIWVYSIWSERERPSTGSQQHLMIDTDDSADWDPFLLLGKGRPCIRNYNQQTNQRHGEVPIYLERPLDVMKSMIGLLVDKCGETHTTPPMVGTLTKLMLSLGKAATVTRRAYI